MHGAMAADSLWQLDAVTLGPARLREVSLDISRGVTAIVGWSGAGKTSLLNVLVGFERPHRGTIHGAPRVAWVPQNGGLWAHCTVREHLEIVRSSRDGIDEVLASFDLAEKAEALPHELSEGEQSRLAVARALASEAGVLVMDEPLVHVDPARVGKYWQAIREHLARTGAALVFSTHAPEIALGEAERIVCLRGGRVLHAGPALTLYENPPTPDLMECLGAGNWFTPPQAQLWLGRAIASDCCVRPEALAIEPVSVGGFVVEEARFRGSIAEAQLRDETSNETRTFFHRPASAALGAGMRVTLRIVSCLLLLIALAGCQRSAAPALVAREIHSWQLPPDGASLPTPRSVTTGNADELAVLDTAGRVTIYNADGVLLRQWKMLDVSVGKPEGIVILKDGRVVVCDTHYHRIVYFDRDGNWLRNFGQRGHGPGEFEYPVGICKDAAENLYICEYGGNDRVQKFTREGEFIAAFGSFGTAPGEFQRPSGLTWHDGKVYVADAINNRVLIFTDRGKYLGLLGPPEQPLAFQLPYDIAFAPDGNLYVIEYGAGRLSRISLEGKLLGQLGHTGSGAGEFATPWGITVDSTMRICIADTKNRRLVTLRL
jgi:ABC-type Fe3+/spermidine/putrescine transport system ATPase subunit/sugar lactone lactonase YvrE